MKKPEQAKLTIADIAPFPNHLDEIDRRSEQFFDIPDNLERIKRNAITLLSNQVLIDGEEMGDALPRFVLEDCRVALRCIEVLEESVEKAANGSCKPCDITAVCEAAFHLGSCDQRMHNRVIYDGHIRKGRQQLQSLSRGPKIKKETAQREYARINARVAAGVKKRGQRKQPSLTEIRHRVADQLGVPYQRVLDAAKGGRKKQ